MLTSFRKDRLLSAKNFALYYGYGKVKELSLFDVVIVDPNGLKLEEYELLRLNNTVVITYLSILEVHPTEPIFQELSFEDFLIVEGKPLKNEAFGTYLVSLRSKKWINHLLNNLNYHFNVIESDGVFLDTIGDIELHVLPSHMKKQQLNAAVNFLSVVKMLYPHHVFIQNNGLEIVAQVTAPLIDGICWENPPFTLEESHEWVQNIIRQLTELNEQHRVKILLLLEETIEKERNVYEQARRIAKKHDFLLYNASKKYVEGFNIIKG
jgi:endo-alpha-1,4-polygalactosaminidase (GH114 family)